MPNKTSMDKAWEAFSRYIRKRDNGVCFTCGEWRPWVEQHAGHWQVRNKHNTMFDEMNVQTQCPECNVAKSGMKNEFGARLVKLFGKKAVETLLYRSNLYKKWSDHDLKEIEHIYKQKIKLLK